MAKTDLFLSHNWSPDEKGRNNHERVAVINEALKKLGYKCWFDSEKMTGNIIDRMCEGVDNTKIILVFVTKTYEEKVGGSNGTDCCKLEFNYSLRKKKQVRMIPVIMEERMNNPADWNGTLGMALGGELAIRMSFDFDAEPGKFQDGINMIKSEIDSRLGIVKSEGDPEPEPEPEPEPKEVKKPTPEVADAKPEPAKSDRFDVFFKDKGGMWSIGGKRIQCGIAGDIPIPDDYFNEGTKRLAVYRPGTGVWFIKGPGDKDWADTHGNIAIQCGIKGDFPVAGDYEGNGKIRLAVWRPGNGNWYFKGPGLTNWGQSSGNQVVQCGTSGDIPVPGDYLKEGNLRMAVWRPSNGNWYIKGKGFDNWGNTTGNIVVQCGISEDIPVPGDYFGDGVYRMAVWRPSNGVWYIKGTGMNDWGKSSGNIMIQCGTKGDIPVPYDFFGEGRLRIAVYRPSNGTWYIKGDGIANWGSTNGNIVYKSPSPHDGCKPVNIRVKTFLDPPKSVQSKRFDSFFKENGGMWLIGELQVQCGIVGDLPIPDDYFNEGKKRLAVYRPGNGTWYIKGAGYDDWGKSNGNIAIQCGIKGDVPVAGDYEGNGKIRLAVWRPGNGNWYFKGPGLNNWGQSSGNQVVQCGTSGDIPVPGDYLKEGSLRMAVWRPSNGNWYIKGKGFDNWGNTTGNIVVQCGISEDIPVPGDYFGDGVYRMAVWRPSNGVWYIKGTGMNDWGKSSGNIMIQCGTKEDIPIPYDFFGEGKLRIAVYRPSNGTWYIKGDGIANWGSTNGNIVFKSPTPHDGCKPVNIRVK